MGGVPTVGGSPSVWDGAYAVEYRVCVQIARVSKCYTKDGSDSGLPDTPDRELAVSRAARWEKAQRGDTPIFSFFALV